MGQGFLKIQLHVGDFALHGQEMTVLIKKDGEILHTLLTDENGTTKEVALACPDLTIDSPSAGTDLFETYDVVVPASHGFMQVSVYGVQIFDGIHSILDIQLEPYVEGGPQEKEIIIPLEHGVDTDRTQEIPGSHIPAEPQSKAEDVAQMIAIPPLNEAILVFNPEHTDEALPAATDITPSAAPSLQNIPLANEVVVPPFITVHLGSPNVSAMNVRVSFRDYIVNVACSEIYPHWQTAAIEANVHAQVSFALNRLFTYITFLRGFRQNSTK